MAYLKRVLIEFITHESFAFVILALIVLAVTIWISGCTAMMLGNPWGENLTPEQVKAYQEVNADVYGCIMVGGPPPAGSTIWLIVPHGAVVNFKIGDGCHLIQ